MYPRGLSPHQGQPRHPAIHLSDHWLKEAGFSTGQPLKLRIMPGYIVITMQDIHELWDNL
ncbi:SymE family type I addiction module toxin [Pectobacterium polaris]|uniref:SymE family type I addiction module toxin n=1 Tax=Pectobacterium polaris TaxID=2042057 RepID=UPI0030B9689A